MCLPLFEKANFKKQKGAERIPAFCSFFCLIGCSAYIKCCSVYIKFYCKRTVFFALLADKITNFMRRNRILSFPLKIISENIHKLFKKYAYLYILYSFNCLKLNILEKSCFKTLDFARGWGYNFKQ